MLVDGWTQFNSDLFNMLIIILIQKKDHCQAIIDNTLIHLVIICFF